jgi:hypothetical protein
MKNLFKIAMIFGLGAILVSCDSQGVIYDNRYPNETVYRAPDGGVYRAGDVYRDRNGYSYRNGAVISGGNVYARKNLPPGQAKKIYGGSAKDYAPGQVKKRNRDYYYDDGYYYDDNGYKKGKKHKKDRD